MMSSSIVGRPVLFIVDVKTFCPSERKQKGQNRIRQVIFKFRNCGTLFKGNFSQKAIVFWLKTSQSRPSCCACFAFLNHLRSLPGLVDHNLVPL